MRLRTEPPPPPPRTCGELIDRWQAGEVGDGALFDVSANTVYRLGAPYDDPRLGRVVPILFVSSRDPRFRNMLRPGQRVGWYRPRSDGGWDTIGTVVPNEIAKSFTRCDPIPVDNGSFVMGNAVIGGVEVFTGSRTGGSYCAEYNVNWFNCSVTSCSRREMGLPDTSSFFVLGEDAAKTLQRALLVP